MGCPTRPLKYFLNALLTMVLFYPSSTHAVSLDPSELRRLENREITWHKEPPSSVRPAEKGFGGTFLMLTKAPPGVVFRLLTDWTRYPKLFSRVRECELAEGSKTEALVRFKVNAIFFTLNYFVRHRIDDQNLSITWDLDAQHLNDLKFNIGSLSVEKEESSGATLVTYALSSDVTRPFFLPAFLKRYYMRREVSRALRELRSMAE